MSNIGGMVLRLNIKLNPALGPLLSMGGGALRCGQLSRYPSLVWIGPKGTRPACSQACVDLLSSGDLESKPSHLATSGLTLSYDAHRYVECLKVAVSGQVSFAPGSMPD